MAPVIMEGELPQSSLTIIPSSSQGLVHGVYVHEQFQSIKIPVTIEWSSCNKTELEKIFKQYRSLDSGPTSVRPRCLGFFEASSIGRFGFVFVDRSYTPRISLAELIRLKPKPEPSTRLRLALAVVDCVEETWTLTQGQCGGRLSSSNIHFHDQLHPSEIPVSKPFLSSMAPPLAFTTAEDFLSIPPQLWANDPVQSMRGLSQNAMLWAFGVVLIEIADWKSFREALSVSKDSSKDEMAAALSRFQAALEAPGYTFKNPKITKIVKFCFQGNRKSTISVQGCCNAVRKLLQE